MKPKQVIIGFLLVACALGAYTLARSRRAVSPVDEEDTAPPVVTVQLGKLERKTLHHYVTGYGTVMPAPATASEPAADAPLAAPVTGVVAKVDAVEGQHVSKGDVLVQLSSGTVTLEYAKEELARQKRLYAQHNTSLRNLQNAEAQLASLQVVAPLSGVVAHLNVKPGAAVDLTTVVAEVIDLSRLVVRTNIPVAEAGELRIGDPVQLLVEPPVAARLSFVQPAVDVNNATVLARAPLPPNNGLRPGQFVELRVVTAVHASCLAAPEKSVVTDVAGHSMIALVHGDEAIRTRVQTGFRENGWVEVKGLGLEAGDSVVTVGAYGLPNHAKIRVAGAAGEAPATSAHLPAAR